MTFENLLINTCTIQRFTEGAADDYGIPAKTWAATYTDQACRHVSGKGREVRVGQEVHIVYDELFVEDIDVTVQDRVIIDTETYQVVDILIPQDGVGVHHKQLFLEIVR